MATRYRLTCPACSWPTPLQLTEAGARDALANHERVGCLARHAHDARTTTTRLAASAVLAVVGPTYRGGGDLPPRPDLIDAAEAAAVLTAIDPDPAAGTETSQRHAAAIAGVRAALRQALTDAQGAA